MHVLLAANRLGRTHRASCQGQKTRHPGRAFSVRWQRQSHRARRGPGPGQSDFRQKTGQLLGAHMVGAEVTELIQGYVIAMNLETTEEELMHTVFPHPTLSEMMKE